ncbi:MAG TPA: hypothetical protein VGR11_16750 [Solirubrobacteraceae bacterium]|nr:hypothetical protein [Solirubrobacteraceae bacterium]
MNRKMFTLLPVLGAIAVGVSACGDSDTATSEPARAASTPQVTFTSPSKGDEVGSKFTAKIDISGFELDPANVGKEAVEGAGHLHFSLDGGKYDNAKFSGANGKLAEQLGTDGKYSPSVTPEITYSDIPAGKHTLVVDLANNDHSDSGQRATTTFTVAGAPAKSAAKDKTGANGEAVSFKDVKTSADGFTADVALSNVELDAKAVGKQAEAGHGHLHFELDGGKYDTSKHSGANGKLAEQLGTDGKYSPSVAPTITYENLPKGKHVLKVYVANNDHSESGAVATRTITVS